MKMVPKYTKVMNLGNSGTERALVGEVVIQEKIDGSQFRFGLNEDREVVMGSKSVNWEHGTWDQMFKAGCDYVLSIEERIKKNYQPDTYFFCEYLQKPKHNVLKYDRIPEGNLILFDVLEAGQWMTSRESLEATAIELDIDVVPELHRGVVTMQRVGAGEKFDRTKGWTGIDFLKNMINQTMSILGGVTIEGVVIKNYNEWMNVGGNIYPVFTKYVRESHKEQHASDWKARSPKATLGDFFASFADENRWRKAIQHLAEKGELTNSVKDIGPLLSEIQRDIKEEEAEDIKNFLYKYFLKDLLRVAIRGFPEWYKEYLMKTNLVGD
jgi:hypothetical protein